MSLQVCCTKPIVNQYRMKHYCSHRYVYSVHVKDTQLTPQSRKAISVCYREYRRTFSKPNEVMKFHNKQISIVVGLKNERELKINIYIDMYMILIYIEHLLPSKIC